MDGPTIGVIVLIGLGFMIMLIYTIYSSMPTAPALRESRNIEETPMERSVVMDDENLDYMWVGKEINSTPKRPIRYQRRRRLGEMVRFR